MVGLGLLGQPLHLVHCESAEPAASGAARLYRPLWRRRASCRLQTGSSLCDGGKEHRNWLDSMDAIAHQHTQIGLFFFLNEISILFIWVSFPLPRHAPPPK